jgi:hypothetical protein
MCLVVAVTIAVPSVSASASAVRIAARSSAAAQPANRWTVGLAAPTHISNGVLAAVSCASGSTCEAAGYYANGTGNGLPCDVDGCPAKGDDFAFAAGRTLGGWTQQQVPIPADSLGTSVDAMSCVSSSYCIAVGAAGTPTNALGSTTSAVPVTPADMGQPLAEVWNGADWRRLSAPSLVHPGVLLGVSCTSADHCVAVGMVTTGQTTEPLVEKWDGTTWTRDTVPFTDDAALTAVSCVSSSSCTAVGYTFTTAYATVDTLVETWNSATWTQVATPDPAGATQSFLYGVSCTATGCMSVGNYTAITADNGQVPTPFSEQGVAGTWTVLPLTPPPGSESTRLLGVSCTMASACTAVGNVYYGPDNSNLQRPLAYRWNGATWVSQHVPFPAGSRVDVLNGVSCPTATSCEAVGFAQTDTATLTLAETWNGSAWTTQTTPNGEGVAGTTDLTGMSCPTTHACVAVGYGTNLLIGGETAIAEIRRGNSSWHMIPPQQAANVALLAVSCVSPSACLAVGQARVSDQGTARWWNGNTWRVVHPVLPAAATGAFYGVSCTSPTACTIVGTGTTAAGGASDVIDRWNGKRLTTQSTTAGLLNAVSCANAHSCTAVGSGLLGDAKPGAPLVIQHWNGHHWSTQYAASPTDQNTVEEPDGPALTGVSCPTPKTCFVVGQYIDANTNYQPLAIEWNGQRWSGNTAPQKANLASGLTAVSCPTVNSCTAVGVTTFQMADHLPQDYDEHWNGSAWSLHHMADDLGTDLPFDAIDCATPSDCTASAITYLPLQDSRYVGVQMPLIETHGSRRGAG